MHEPFPCSQAPTRDPCCCEHLSGQVDCPGPPVPRASGRPPRVHGELQPASSAPWAPRSVTAGWSPAPGCPRRADPASPHTRGQLHGLHNDVQLWGGAAWPLSCLLSPPRPRVRSQLRVTQARAGRGLWLSPAGWLVKLQLRASKSWPCGPEGRLGPLLSLAGRGELGPVTVKGFSQCADVHTCFPPSLARRGPLSQLLPDSFRGTWARPAARDPGSPPLQALGRGSGKRQAALGAPGPAEPGLASAAERAT